LRYYDAIEVRFGQGSKSYTSVKLSDSGYPWRTREEMARRMHLIVSAQPSDHNHNGRMLRMMQSSSAVNPASVLIVDDDRDAREMLSEYLAFCGFVVYRAQDGGEAIDVAVRVQPGVVLMDLMMPRMDGWEATRRLKTDDRTRGISIVAVSACSHSEDQARARRVGCEHFVPKPIDLEQLACLVNRLLARRPPDSAPILK
jgi:two-component system cell cycle response regulator DivK